MLIFHRVFYSFCMRFHAFWRLQRRGGEKSLPREKSETSEQRAANQVRGNRPVPGKSGPCVASSVLTFSTMNCPVPFKFLKNKNKVYSGKFRCLPSILGLENARKRAKKRGEHRKKHATSTSLPVQRTFSCMMTLKTIAEKVTKKHEKMQ